MSYATVIVHDLEVDQVATTVFSPPDYDIVKRQWVEEDRILLALQYHHVFEGRTRWCDLEPVHFRVMIAKNLQLASKLTVEERNDPQNAINKGLNFLLLSFVYCLQERSDVTIDLLRVFRNSEDDVYYTISASVCRSMSALSRVGKTDDSKNTTGLRLFVDNEK